MGIQNVVILKKVALLHLYCGIKNENPSIGTSFFVAGTVMLADSSVQLVSDSMSHMVLRSTILKAQDITEKKVITRRIFL
jgi:hypothetical protein